MNNVIDLKGKPVEPPKDIVEEPTKTAKEHADFVVVAFLQSVLSMHQAAQLIDFTQVSLKDEQGKIWSAPAVMNLIDRHMDYIRLKMGKNFKPFNQRR